MSRVSSAQVGSVRVGAQVYQINLTPAQLDKRNIEKERERRISRETSKRRKALEERRKQAQLKEEKERQTELLKRRERQREATERYQRAHIPIQSRRKFSSPVLRSPINPNSFRKNNNADQAIKDIRGYYSATNCIQVENEEHSRRTSQKQHDFNQVLREHQHHHHRPGTSFLNAPYQIPTPPNYPKPPQSSHHNPQPVKTAWTQPPSALAETNLEESSRAPSRCDKRIEDGFDQPESPEELEEPVEDLEATFTIQEKAISLKRSSTPDLVEANPNQNEESQSQVMTRTNPVNQSNTMQPNPPPHPKPPAKAKDPRVKKIEIMNRDMKTINSINNINVITHSEMSQAKANQNVANNGPSHYGEDEGMKVNEEKETKSILKARSYNRRIVSAGRNGGLVAASIRDSLELLGKHPEKSSKSVKWDRLYYDDNSIADFGNDGKPQPIIQTKKKGKKATQGKAQTVKNAEKKSTGKGKNAKKEPVESIRINKMVTRNNQFSIVPHPSSGSSLLRTETPIIKPEYDFSESSRIPIPPSVPRPLTSRTQVIRSRRQKTQSGPIKGPVIKTYRTNNNNDPQLILNSNNQYKSKKQVNIHIGSVEINENLEKTPTDQEINWLWERVRSALESQQSQIHPHNPAKRPKTAPRAPTSRTPTYSKHTRPSSAVNTSSTSNFVLAEQMTRRGVSDDRIMGIIDPQQNHQNPPMTQLSLEEQQIQQSLLRLDNRLVNIQDQVTHNQSARDLQFQINSMFHR